MKVPGSCIIFIGAWMVLGCTTFASDGDNDRTTGEARSNASGNAYNEVSKRASTNTSTAGHEAENSPMETAEHLPVNLIEYSPVFASAGQPGTDYIQTLAAQNVAIVINIAPSTAHGALPEEAHLVSAAGMTYLNIPVDWNRPTQQQFEQFLGFMRDNADSKVFLHCQMNMRASAYAFLHRVINLNLPTDAALADLLSIWTPNPTWASFMNEALQTHGISFEVPAQQP